MVSITDCHFLTFEKKDFQTQFEKIEKRLVEEKVTFLRNLHFFKGWSKINTKKQLAAYMAKVNKKVI